MPGTKGRSGGHNRKTAEQHALAGNFRRDRHAQPPRTSGPPALTATARAESAALVDRLERHGAQLLERAMKLKRGSVGKITVAVRLLDAADRMRRRLERLGPAPGTGTPPPVDPFTAYRNAKRGTP